MVFEQIWSWLRNGSFPIAGVEIVSGSYNPEFERGGWVGDTTSESPITHWVAITGISKEFRRFNAYSRWNWLRIFNPYS